MKATALVAFASYVALTGVGVAHADPVRQVHDHETPPALEGHLVLQVPAIGRSAFDEHLYRSGATLRTAGAIVAVTGLVASTAGLVLVASAGGAQGSAGGGSMSGGELLVLGVFLGGIGEGSIDSDSGEGVDTGLVGGILLAAGAGAVITGLIMTSVGISRRERAERARRVEPWLSPTGTGLIGGVTIRR